MDVIDDLAAEQECLDAVLAGLPGPAWLTASGAAGWTIADVVLHLAQSEEGVAATVAGAANPMDWRRFGDTVDDAMAAWVRSESTDPAAIFERWRAACRASVAALRSADPARPLTWVATALKPRTLATTRLAEHWAHALDVTGPLGIAYPDTDRLRHIAWLGFNTLPYAFALAGEEPHDVFCELVGPDGATWRYGDPGAGSSITGPAGAFCRVGARRLAADDSGLDTTGPYGRAALRVLRNYAST